MDQNNPQPPQQPVNPNQVKMEQVLGVLKAQGLDDTQVGEFIVNLNNLLAEQVQQRLITAIPKEELEKIETLPEEQIQEEIISKFESITNRKIQEVSDEILATFLDAFLEGVKEEQEDAGTPTTNN